jgi:16S rRNA (adenine1518-N6/adenine1519-N6)-dimethyltransferase
VGRHERNHPRAGDEPEGGEPEGDRREASGTPDLTNPSALRALLRRHGIARPNKSLGQHLLVSRAALDAVVRAAALSPEDAVLEVGAGTGVLTVELAARAGRVVAVELDRALLPVLRETTAALPNVEIMPRNLLDVRPEEVVGAQSYKLVANLPYYITALTLRHFLEAAHPPRLLVVMVQREVAERIVARAGEMNLLGLSVQFYGTPRIVAHVPASAFYPPPKVDSAVVRVALHPTPLLPPKERDRLFALARAGFAEKRKQLHNSLARHAEALDATTEMIAAWLAAADIDPTRRAQTLDLGDWLRLTYASLAARDSQDGGFGERDASDTTDPEK